MRSNKHTSVGKADWEHLPVSKRNGWQRLAANTRGIITPANLLSIAGASVVVYGLFLIADRNIAGVVFVLIGRLADIADGYIARFTGTRSSLGEALDATLDKLLLLGTLIVLWVAALIPAWLIILMLVHGTLNSVISLYAKLRNIPVHPVPSGKYSTAALWGSIVALSSANLMLEPSELLDTLLLIAGYFSAALFIYLAAVSSADYLRQLESTDGRK